MAHMVASEVRFLFLCVPIVRIIGCRGIRLEDQSCEFGRLAQPKAAGLKFRLRVWGYSPS